MAKQYREYTPNELGTNKRTNWTWLMVDIGQESLWYTNGHIVMTKSPVREWPTEVPAGAKTMPWVRQDAIRNLEGEITPYEGQHMAKYLEPGKELHEVGRTERGNRLPYGVVTLSDWDGSGIRSSWNETIEIQVSRAYYSFLRTKYRTATFHASKRKGGPVVLVKDNTAVALLMPILK